MNNRIHALAGRMLMGAASVAVGGCGVVEPTPRLPASAFVANRAVVGPEAGEGIDQPGALVYEAHKNTRPEAQEPTYVSDTVRDVVKPPGANLPVPATQTAQAPASTEPAATQPYSITQFQWVGFVIATVERQPIYADKVLKPLEHALQAEAKAGDESHFRSVAQDLIGKQIQEFISNELEYAVAKKSLEKKDEQYAKLMTSEWRKEQIRKAGGSEAQARQRAAEDGVDFEEAARQQFRINLTQIYYQTKIFPLIQVRVQDMRQYYTANIRSFQKPGAVKFRVIWISDDAHGGRDMALKAAKEVCEQVRNGEDFAEVAGSKTNDDKTLMTSKGAVGDEKGWMEKGGFVSEQLEDAVWLLKPTEVTAPIRGKARGSEGFWIARLEDIHPGRSEPFEDTRVQDAIRNALRREQFVRRRAEQQQRLERDAVIVYTPGFVEAMMQMVMQRYYFWRAT